MAERYPVIEVYNEEWKVIAKVDKKNVTFMLAIHISRPVAAQIVQAATAKVIVTEMEISHMPPPEVFERIFGNE